MANEIEVRKAVSGDLTELHKVVERAYRGDSAKQGWTHEADLLFDTRTDMATLEALVASDDDCLLVAALDGIIIGCVCLSRRDGRGCYLGLLCIEPTLQAGGYGKMILSAAEDFARGEFGADHIVMTVIDKRTELIAYYQRRGYALTGETCDFPVRVDPPLFMVILRKDI